MSFGWHSIITKVLSLHRFAEEVQDIKQLSSDQRLLLNAMTTCHSLTIINGILSGDPLDLIMFNATDWVCCLCVGRGGGDIDPLPSHTRWRPIIYCYCIQFESHPIFLSSDSVENIFPSFQICAIYIYPAQYTSNRCTRFIVLN